MTTQQEEMVIRLSRKFNAPLDERVFDAWTDPEVLREWWSTMPTMQPTLARSTCARADATAWGCRTPRAAGSTSSSASTAEIRRPQWLAYTWVWEGSPGDDRRRDELVEIEFREDGEGTEVVLTHTGLPTDESRGQHAHGWNGCFDSLAAYLG